MPYSPGTPPLPANPLSPAIKNDPPVQESLESWLDSVADALSHSGWTRQTVIPLLSSQLIEQLRQEALTLHQTSSMTQAGVGQGAAHTHDRSVRRDKIAWMTGITDSQNELFVLFERIRTGLNRRLFCGLQRFEAHYATYEPGDFYRRHLDGFRTRRARFVSVVLYLNDDWKSADGGQLQIYNLENRRELCASVLPEAGHMAVFLSEEIPHEVLRTNRTRYSIACWFRTDAIPGLAL